MRADIVRPDRPAAMLYPVAPLKVDVVIFGAAAAPDGGRSTEEAQTAMFERVVMLADDVTTIEVGRCIVMIEATAFDQQNAMAVCQKPPGGSLTGSTRTDNCNVCRDRFGRVKGTIDPH